MFHSFCVTVTQDSRNIIDCFKVYMSLYCLVLYGFKSLMTCSYNYIVRTVTNFDSRSKWNFITFFCVNITHISCKGIFIVFEWILSNVFHCFQVNTSLSSYYFLLSYWRPVVIIILLRLLQIFCSLSIGIIPLSFVWVPLLEQKHRYLNKWPFVKCILSLTYVPHYELIIRLLTR